MDSNKRETQNSDSQSAARRRIRLGWMGLGGYLLIFANAIRFAGGLPYQVLLLGQILNLAIITFIVLEIRKAYKKLRNGSSPQQ